MFRDFYAVLAVLLVLHSAIGAFGALKSLNLVTVEQIRRELIASNRLLLGNETSDDYEYDEAIMDSDLMDQLRNVTIKVHAKKVFPFVVFRELENGQQRISGYVGEVWSTLEEHLGFKTQFVAEKNNGNGWDVLLNPKELSLKKLTRYSYTLPIAKIWYHLFAKGLPYSSNSVVYFRIFDKQLWAVLIIACLVLSIALWAIWKVRRKALDGGRSKRRTKRNSDTNYSTCILSVLGCLINQGSQFKTEKSSSIRIITLMCIVLGLFITTSFSALLISKLATVEDVTGEKIGSLKSLAESPRGKTLCVATHSYAYSRMIVHQEPHYMKKSKLKINGFPCTPGDHDYVPSQDYCAPNTVVMETTFNTDHAFNAHPIEKSQRCIIYIYTRRYFNSHLILVVRKHFPYLRIINKYLLRMEESGLAKKLSEAWRSDQSNQENGNLNSQNKLKVSFYHIRPIILAYLGAVVVSLLLLGLERLYKWLSDN